MPRSTGVLVRGRLEALLTRALYYDLVERAVVETRDGTETLGIWSDGAFFAMAAAGPFADLL